MRPVTPVFAMLLACLTVQVLAQTITRSVGPDGRVIYSDRPVAEASDSRPLDIPTHSTLQHPSPPPTIAPSRELAVDEGAQPAAAMAPVDKAVDRQRSDSAAKPAKPAPKPLESAVERAIVGVLGFEDLVAQTEALCVGVLPTSFARYNGAADGWRARNAELVERAHRILSEAYGQAQAAELEATLHTRNAASLKPIVDAPKAAQIAWCDESSDSFDDRSMDVTQKENLMRPLTSYRP